MSPPAQRLSYGPRRVWAAITLGLTVLALLEVWVGHLIVSRLLGPPWSTGVDVVLVVATVVLTGVVGTPLAARPRLTSDHLVLDLAGMGRAALPLTEITSVESYQPSAAQPIPPGAVVDGDPPVATFSLGSTGGHLRLTTREPIPVRHSLFKRASADVFIVRLADAADALAQVQSALRAAPAGD